MKPNTRRARAKSANSLVILCRKNLAKYHCDLSCAATSPEEGNKFNIGVGLGMLCMLISHRKELAKIYKLLEQTQASVNDLQKQLYHRTNFPSADLPISGSPQQHLSETETALLKCHQSNRNQRVSEHSSMTKTVVTGSCIEAQGSVKSDTIAQDIHKNYHMEELEAELEAELELMQLNLTSGLPFEDHLPSDFVELNPYNDAPCSLNFSESSCSEAKRESSLHIDKSITSYAVSPFELDRRLRDVLEARQEKRIIELEAQLNETEKELSAKENELSSWKDHVKGLTQFPTYASPDDDFCASETSISDLEDTYQIDSHVMKDLVLKKTSPKHHEPLKIIHIDAQGMQHPYLHTSGYLIQKGSGAGLDCSEEAKRFPFFVSSLNRSVSMDQIGNVASTKLTQTALPELGHLQNSVEKMNIQSGPKGDQSDRLHCNPETQLQVPSSHLNSESSWRTQYPACAGANTSMRSLYSKKEIKKEPLMIATNGSEVSYQECSPIQSSVTEKIKHWEAISPGEPVITQACCIKQTGKAAEDCSSGDREDPEVMVAESQQPHVSGIRRSMPIAKEPKVSSCIKRFSIGKSVNAKKEKNIQLSNLCGYERNNFITSESGDRKH